MCMSSVKSYKALYALRFLVGLFEYVGHFSYYLSTRSSLISEIDLGFTPAFIIFSGHGTHHKRLASAQ